MEPRRAGTTLRRFREPGRKALTLRAAALPRWNTGPENSLSVCGLYKSIQNGFAKGEEREKGGSFLEAGTAPLQITRMGFACNSIFSGHIFVNEAHSSPRIP